MGSLGHIDRLRLPNWWLLLAAILMLLGEQGWADTYRWVDEQGKVHYSDQVPPEHAKHERARLNQEGRRVERIEAAKTPEQLARERQLKAWRAEQQRLLIEQHDRDLALLRSYRSEEEMHQALQGKLNTIDAMIKVAQSNKQRQHEYLRALQQKAAELELQGKTIHQTQRDTIAATQRQIALHEEKIAALEREKKRIEAQFAHDLQRFRLLQTQRVELERFSLWLESSPTNPDETTLAAVTCQPGPDCEQAWQRAKNYLAMHSAHPLFTETERILQTHSPEKDEDIGLIVVRIDGRGETILFLDLRCRPSSLGEETCASARARQIRAGFKPALQ